MHEGLAGKAGRGVSAEGGLLAGYLSGGNLLREAGVGVRLGAGMESRHWRHVQQLGQLLGRMSAASWAFWP